MSDKISYKDAGVDIEEAAAFVGDIDAMRQRTEHSRKLCQSFGLFAAAYDLSDYDQPVMVTGCDGVGTKLKLLLEQDLLEEVGMDLVAMSVNDILTTGGDPLLFLDYVGVHQLEKAKIARLIDGMSRYLADCNCILAGGETAEMPGLVHPDLIDLSGFCVGAVEKKAMLDPSRVAFGDVVVGFPSQGFHANGFSLVRKVIADKGIKFSKEEYQELLKPTLLYHEVVNANKALGLDVKAYAHITGGGFPENLQRFLAGKGAEITLPRWENEVAQRILEHVEEKVAIDTFNMGFGWVCIMESAEAEKLLKKRPEGKILGVIREGEFNVKISA